MGCYCTGHWPEAAEFDGATHGLRNRHWENRHDPIHSLSPMLREISPLGLGVFISNHEKISLSSTVSSFIRNNPARFAGRILEFGICVMMMMHLSFIYLSFHPLSNKKEVEWWGPQVEGSTASIYLHLGICLPLLNPYRVTGLGWLDVSSTVLPSGETLQYSFMSLNTHSISVHCYPPCFETRETKPRDFDAAPNLDSLLVSELKIKYRTYDWDVNLWKSQPWAQGRFLQRLFCVLCVFFFLCF